MSSIGSPSPFFLAGKKAYEVERSLRFNDGDSAYLNRTPSGAGNRRTWTLSFWAKISDDDLGSHGFLFSTGADASNKVQINIESSNRITFEAKSGGSTQANIRPSNNLRDVSAWYHFVIRVDTTDSTSTNRIKFYINGTQQTDLASNTFPSQHTEFEWNKAQEHNIGKRTYSSNYFNGYLAEINFIDGQTYDPSYFGETDEKTGQWIPKKYVGSYGTNGFYLNFSDNSGTTATTLGKDSSGQSNNFTPYNFATSDAVKDSPTNNFCTINAVGENLLASGSIPIFSEGNLKSVLSGNGYGTYWKSTFGMTSGKWYWEVLSQNSESYANIGVNNFSARGSTAGTGVFYQSNGYRNPTTQNTDTTSYGASYTTGDIIGIAFDADAESITFYKNNSSQGAVGSVLTQANAPYFAAVGDGSNAQQYTFIVNFGQDSSFAGQKTAQGNTDGSGQGDFYYTPPTGYKSLCSANLPDPTIKLPNKHFDTFLYSATGNAMSFPNELNFQPDWIWQKSRNSTVSSNVHYTMDAVRGGDKGLVINSTNAEFTGAAITFTSNGYDMGASSGGQGNASGNSYVSWNWNGGDVDSKTYTVKVVSDSGNKYRFDDFGTSAVTLDLAEGGTYIFDQSDSSNAGHPLRFSTTSNGTHGGGSEYTTGVTTAGTPGQSGAYTQIVVAASAPTLYYYCTQHSGMGGAINTNSTLGSSNFDGSTQSTVKANPTAGFSIVTYTGQQNASDTIGHGLGVKPQVVISKSRNATYTYTQWYVHHYKLTTNYFAFLNTNSAAGDGLGDYYIDGSFSSTVFAVGDDIYGPNVSNNNYVAYCFSEVEGYSKFGSYTGNGSSDGPFVFTGFRPAWVLIKCSSSTFNWMIYDSKREPFNLIDKYLMANSANAEAGSSTDNPIDFLSNGFKLRYTNTSTNQNGGTYIYLAFAESPFKNARAR